MGQPAHNLAHIPRELRLSNLGYGLGVTKLFKGATPAAGGGFTRTIPAEYWERMISLAFQLATSAVVKLRTLSVIYSDQDSNTFNLVPVATQIGAGETFTTYGDLASVTSVQPVTIPPATATAAAAGNATATLPVGASLAGIVINWGSVAVANSVTITVANAQTNGSLVWNVALATGQNSPFIQNFTVPLQAVAGQAITVTVTGNANSPTATIAAYGTSAITLSAAGAQIQLPDFLMHSGWSWGIQLGNPDPGDQISGVLMLTERFPSDLAGGYQRPDGQLFYPGPP